MCVTGFFLRFISVFECEIPWHILLVFFLFLFTSYSADSLTSIALDISLTCFRFPLNFRFLSHPYVACADRRESLSLFLSYLTRYWFAFEDSMPQWILFLDFYFLCTISILLVSEASNSFNRYIFVIRYFVINFYAYGISFMSMIMLLCILLSIIYKHVIWEYVYRT